MNNKAKRLVLVVGIASLIAGCGGGGGSGVRTEPQPVTQEPPPTPEPPPEKTEGELREEYAANQEFKNQPALAQVKAHYAYARGATGEGVVIGLVDAGVDAGHPELQGKLHPESYHLEGYNPDYNVCPSRDQDGYCAEEAGPPAHGTFVGGIIAAHRETESADNASIHGIAFDATLFSVGLPLDDPPEYYEPVDLDQPELFISTSETFAEISNELNQDVAAVNLSLGFSGNIKDYHEAEIRAAFPHAIAAIAQADTRASARTIYVWAAGNATGAILADGAIEPGDSVELMAGLPARIPELLGHSLAVVAVDQDGVIAEFSNRCGIAEEFCLAAPGVEITGPVPNVYCPVEGGPGACYATSSGTSAAAPLVSGGVALLVQHYRDQLGNHEIVKRLLDTANKDGIYADSLIYGQGLLDLDAATRPLGETRLLTGHSLTGASALESLSALSVAPAFGDALTHGLAGREIAAFDELDAPFFRRLDDYIRPTSAAVRLEERLWTLGNDPRGAPWRAGRLELRARFDRAVTRYHPGLFSLERRAGSNDIFTGIHHYPGRFNHVAAEYQVGSLSMTYQAGNNDVFIGYRSHPAWRFGLHAAGTSTGSAAAVIAPGTFTDNAAFTNPFLALGRDGPIAGVSMPVGKGAFSMAAFHGAAQYGEQRVADGSRATGTLAEYRFADTVLADIAIQAGWLREPRRLAGSRSSGAFGELGASTGFMGIAAHHRLGKRWTVLAGAHGGFSRVDMQNQGMLQDASALWTSAFGVGIVGHDVVSAQDRLSLRFSQPLRVESGNARLRWTSGRTRARQVRLEEAVINLEPSGRQLDLELTYAQPWRGGLAHLAMLASRHPAHTRGEDDFALLMRYSRDF